MLSRAFGGYKSSFSADLSVQALRRAFGTLLQFDRNLSVHDPGALRRSSHLLHQAHQMVFPKSLSHLMVFPKSIAGWLLQHVCSNQTALFVGALIKGWPHFGVLGSMLVTMSRGSS